MLFNIELDLGSRIVGYLVPDSFSESPSLRVTDGEHDLLVLPCQEERPALVAAGRHATGRCGFNLDETIVADLAQQETLELYDQETNILIYRRRPPAQLTEKRIFRLETHLVPLERLDDSVESHFQYYHKGIERHGRETTTQVFLLNNSSSLYLSGRLLLKSYEYYINETFECIALLRDPYIELAERLLALKNIGRSPIPLFGDRDLMTFGPVIEFAQDIENDEKLLRRAFAMMPTAAIAILANPLTRQLAARNAEEVLAKGSVATALGTLSAFAIVGIRERQELFLAQLADLLGIGTNILPEIGELGAASQLAAQLRFVPEAGLLIDHDLEVYRQVKSAVENAAAD